jgi:hypothetical protein
MTARRDNGDLLSSWKEIADYLGCEERTCRRWERNLGLPIHRMEGTTKSRVYAYKAELDSWRKQKLNSGVSANGELGFEEIPPGGPETHGIGHNVSPAHEPEPGTRVRPDASRRESQSNPLAKKLLWLVPAAGVILAPVLFLPGRIPASRRILESRAQNSSSLMERDMRYGLSIRSSIR